MTLTRQQIVAVTKSFLGTPWVHQGRTRAGVDCVGLVVAVARELGVYPPGLIIPPYRTQPDASLLSYFDDHMVALEPRDMQAGSVAVYAYGGSPYHAGIIIDVNLSSLIHAYASKRKVVYDHIDSKTKGRTLFGVYDFPGVTNG
jgi:cell wall-associated NlpC family hydrolase